MDNIVYDISSQPEFYASKEIIFEFSTMDGTSTNIEMNVTKTTSLTNETICSSIKVLSSGSIVCIIPLSFYNSTYTAKIYKDGDFLGWQTYTDELSPQEIFGDIGVFLGAFGYLMLAFMGISSASISLILGLIGLIAMSLMMLLNSGAFFGVGSTFIWLIIAVTILLWKYEKRRTQQ